VVTLKRDRQLQFRGLVEDVAAIGTVRLNHAYLQIGVGEIGGELVVVQRSCVQHPALGRHTPNAVSVQLARSLYATHRS
jgi:hypothetical protein